MSQALKHELKVQRSGADTAALVLLSIARSERDSRATKAHRYNPPSEQEVLLAR